MASKESGYSRKRRAERGPSRSSVRRTAEKAMQEHTRFKVTDRSPSTGAPNRSPRSLSDGRGSNQYLTGGGRWQGSSRTLPEPRGGHKRKKSPKSPTRLGREPQKYSVRRKLPKTR